MSYILKALRKSELERQDQVADTLHQRLISAQSPTVIRQSSKKFIVLIVINITLMGYLLIDRLFENTDSNLTFNSKQIAQNSEQVEEREIEPQIQTKDKAVSNKGESPQLKDDIAVQTETKKKTFGANKQNQLNSTPKQSNQIYRNKSVKPEVSHPKKEEAIEQSVEQNLSVMMELQQKPQSSIPFVEELPFDIRRDLPNLEVNVFGYSVHPEDSFVIVNMKKYRVGQLIDDGLRIEEIADDCLIVSYKNTVFKIKRP